MRGKAEALAETTAIALQHKKIPGLAAVREGGESGEGLQGREGFGFTVRPFQGEGNGLVRALHVKMQQRFAEECVFVYAHHYAVGRLQDGLRGRCAAVDVLGKPGQLVQTAAFKLV